MEKKFKSPRGGMIVFLCVAVAALWLTAVYGTYEDNQREKYEVRITPGAVSYGTHSSAIVPVVMTTTRHTSSVPMVSGDAVRSYAHYGHASMPSTTSSGKGLYATSSATVKTIGSGGGASGGGAAASSGASSSRGIRYGGGTVASVAMPILAVNNMQSSMFSTQTAETYASQYRAMGPRRAKPTYTGSDGDTEQDDEDDNKWWTWDNGSWREVTAGDTWYDPYDDCIKIWVDGYGWADMDEYGDPIVPTPLGATPWLMMVLLACAYALYKYYTHKVYTSK